METNATLVLNAAGGEITGRIKFQKMFYLLEQLGMNSQVAFSYHHYGPYSEDLSRAIELASCFGPVKEELRYDSYGNKYSAYSLEKSEEVPEKLGDLPWDLACKYVTVMKDEPSTILEVASTIHWLQNKEQVPDWRNELKKRKGSKADDTRIDKAINLLSRLGISVLSEPLRA